MPFSAKHTYSLLTIALAFSIGLFSRAINCYLCRHRRKAHYYSWQVNEVMFSIYSSDDTVLIVICLTLKK